MIVPKSIDIDVNNQVITIKTFDSDEYQQNLNGQAVNIFASGPSISEIGFDQSLLATPSIFVNGSLDLLNQHLFKNVVGYVISDERFIKHKPDFLVNTYRGQPLYATISVVEAIAHHNPEVIEQYQESIRIIYAVDRPLDNLTQIKPKNSWKKISNLFKIRKNKRIALADFSDHPNFVIDNKQTSLPIGVSLDITYGFVEAGTVAYVATQLAFSRHASVIHLYGIDLLNSNQPRFYEDKHDNAPSKLDKAISDRIVPSFDLLGKVYREHKVAVINHSSVSASLFNHLD